MSSLRSLGHPPSMTRQTCPTHHLAHQPRSSSRTTGSPDDVDFCPRQPLPRTAETRTNVYTRTWGAVDILQVAPQCAAALDPGKWQEQSPHPGVSAGRASELTGLCSCRWAGTASNPLGAGVGSPVLLSFYLGEEDKLTSLRHGP